jgi:hypothetical protein
MVAMKLSSPFSIFVERRGSAKRSREPFLHVALFVEDWATRKAGHINSPDMIDLSYGYQRHDPSSTSSSFFTARFEQVLLMVSEAIR